MSGWQACVWKLCIQHFHRMAIPFYFIPIPHFLRMGISFHFVLWFSNIYMCMISCLFVVWFSIIYMFSLSGHFVCTWIPCGCSRAHNGVTEGCDVTCTGGVKIFQKFHFSKFVLQFSCLCIRLFVIFRILPLVLSTSRTIYLLLPQV